MFQANAGLFCLTHLAYQQGDQAIHYVKGAEDEYEYSFANGLYCTQADTLIPSRGVSVSVRGSNYFA